MRTKITKQNLSKKILIAVVVAILVYLMSQDLEPVIEKIKKIL